MAPVLSRDEMTFNPDRNVFSFRDRDCDAGLHADAAVRQAYRDGAGATDHELFVKRAGERLAVRARIEVHDSAPTAPPEGDDWT